MARHLIPDIRQSISSPETLGRWLRGCGLRNVERGVANLQTIAGLDWSDAEISRFVSVLAKVLPELSDPDQALNNLERLISVSDSLAQKVCTLSSLATPFRGLLTLVSDSQYLSDLLRDEENFDVVAVGRFQPLSRKLIVSTAVAMVDDAKDAAEAMRRLRKFRQRETLRTAWCDLVLNYRIEQVTEQISAVAAAVCEAALFWCRRRLVEKFGSPYSQNADTCRYVILALGKLGGNELNYSSDIDLIAVYEIEGKIHDKAVSSNQEYFAQLTRDFVRMVGEPTELGSAYRVDMRLRPSGSRGPICKSIDSTLQYYDLQGRTWERQAMIKARPLAGDRSLGNVLLDRLQPWIFRPSLSRTDIAGIKSLKRQMERRTQQQGEDRVDIKTGYGGIRDVEFVIQFMQLLNGWNLASLRTANTLRAIGRLERAQCLTHEEAELLAGNYRWLRKLEHRLQIMHNQQTHSLPTDDASLDAFAKRMGIRKSSTSGTLHAFREKLDEVTRLNRVILDHLLHGAFGTSRVFQDAEAPVSAVVDLILDPDPSPEFVAEVLEPYQFSDPQTVWRILMELAEEKSQFISSRRCKHFFASIAHSLLSEVARTPEPDRTLISLASVSDSLGARGVLWELFSESPPTLNLYVRLCASSDYLATILKTSPGMVDELMDALQLDSLPSREWLQQDMDELSRGAVEIDLILSSFKSTQHMRIGVRDILNQDEIADTHRALSDVADICLQKVTSQQTERQLKKFSIDWETPASHAVPFAVLGLGKLGGREPNYHSDLDVIFFYDSDPEFESLLPKGTSPQSFFSQLAAEIVKAIGKQVTHRRLYEIDSRLRPSGKSGSLAVHVEEFARYFDSGPGQLWERQALCKSRPVAGNPELGRKIMAEVRKNLTLPCPDSLRDDIWKMRLAMQRDSQPGNLKRGHGGTVDIEFVVQMLQLAHADANPEVLTPGTLNAIESLSVAGLMKPDDAEFFREQYQFLRSVESGLRLMNTTARHDLPENESQLERLALLLNFSNGGKLSSKVSECREAVRQRAESLFRIT
ncbi:bifunctional [glutamate--ammonia ligase]-adenylyl-L-tyrosine phosphorylase/[glutamate--ammonia-ligase] adenylyltransferase [Mariniblastus fucicola]|uniref:Glutamate-ammonia-ligase adenylyltransferase n=1 Tax=Mariniblastus fucicola TaxID=980251 RepID=A0A5B9PDE6_9BACT|nr:bifunctional [glutamate--ammonia ligase]-adenylyl-L-tyrosine phosphorylase/[glutamate--ammonia-ligase] adenylyltransferase [Mariniblastus fucicola]QEG24334.1 Glutamate-ammonia-ligase adenylyltransferase [Mariniblastus fucicola]